MSLEIWCRHFTGVQHDKCEADVSYRDVRINGEGMARFPCIDPNHRHTCTSFAPYTADEIAEHERGIQDVLQKLRDFEERKTDTCLHCEKQVSRLEKVGRCVYARPCGCRLWQGGIPAVWQAQP